MFANFRPSLKKQFNGIVGTKFNPNTYFIVRPRGKGFVIKNFVNGLIVLEITSHRILWLNGQLFDNIPETYFLKLWGIVVRRFPELENIPWPKKAGIKYSNHFNYSLR